VVLWAVGPAILSGAQDVQVESSRAVPSPDNKFTVTVDRLMPVIDGTPDKYSGKMVVRVSSGESTVPIRQRFIEATQVRFLDQPIWLEKSPWCAFVYNVAKNASGLVYMNAETGRAIQIELVALTRRMGATQSIEQEITSLEVSDHLTKITRTHNIPKDGASLFPLVLKKLPLFEGKPFNQPELEEVIAALDAFQQFLAKLAVESLDLEQASETISPDGKHLAVLACAGGKQFLIVVPVGLGSPAATFQKVVTVELDKSLQLSCGLAASVNGETPEVESMGGDFRYATAWNGSNIVVEREVFGAEDDEPKRERVYVISAQGEILKFNKPATLSKPQESKTGASGKDLEPAEKSMPTHGSSDSGRNEPLPLDTETTGAAASAKSGEMESEKSTEPVGKSRARLSVKMRTEPTIEDTTPADNKPSARDVPPAAKSQPAATKGVEKRVTEEFHSQPSPIPSPAVETKKPGLLQRLLPSRSRTTPAVARPAYGQPVVPAEAQKTPSD
jgi:hypothetical protein